MADLNLKKQIDEILGLIDTSEKAVRAGTAVDLKPLERKVARLYESIASVRRSKGDMARDDLISSLDTILDRLDHLEREVGKAQGAKEPNGTAGAR